MQAVWKAGYPNLPFDGVSSNGFNVGVALLDCSSKSGMYYGLDGFFAGLFNKADDFQSIVSVDR